MTDFSDILGNAFETVASEHGLYYKEGGATAWGRAGAAYLAYVLCHLPTSSVRSLQYAARELTGAVLLDCKWYDRLVELCLDGQDQITAGIYHPQKGISPQIISKSLFEEMLDFCREG